MRRRLITIAIFLLAGAVVNVGVAWGCVWWLPIVYYSGSPASKAVARAFHKRLDSPVIRYDRHASHRSRSFYTELAMSDTSPPCWIFTATTWTSCSHSFAVAVTTQARYDKKMSYDNLPRRVKKDVVPFWSRMRERPSVALALSSESSQYDPTDLSHHEVLYEDAYGWPMLTLSTGVLGSTRGNKQTYTTINGIEIGDFLLPLRPIWTSFAVSTFFYGGILWLLIPGPFALRRLIRRLIRRRRGLCPACGYDLRHGEHQACPECGVTA